jgi:hypothetical protein
MDGVPWTSNFHDTLVFNDRVFVSTAMGYPVIIGVLPRISEEDDAAPPVHVGDRTETGNYTSLSHGLVGDPTKPTDIVSGDKILSNRMGALLGVLRGGTIIAKASRLSQILLSKYDDLVRIVGRSFELFTDLSVDVYASVRGRAYRYTGYANSLSSGRSDNYRYEELHGDTKLANSLKWNYYGLTPSSFSALPAADSIIRKYRIVDGANLYYYQDLYYDDGRLYTKVQTAAGTAYTEINQTNSTLDIKTDDGTSYTRVQTTPSVITLTYNGTNVGTILMNGTNLKLTYTVGGNSHTVVMDSSKVELTFVGGVTNKVTIDGTKVKMDYSNGTHFLSVDSTGVHMG